ncbi:MAG: hypothetical protein IPM02_04985 [Betaproteobacteria bacterium]|nr:hypothetical protein [Betaproteobacteria bacterium]
MQHRGVDVFLNEFARRRLVGLVEQHRHGGDQQPSGEQQGPLVAVAKGAQAAAQRARRAGGHTRCRIRTRVLRGGCAGVIRLRASAGPAPAAIDRCPFHFAGRIPGA